jgi:WD40 repeat protein/serine/threonine protein kinase
MMGAADSGHYDLLDLLAEEFAARYRRGERPSLKEYVDRYPLLADEIRELFPALVEMEQVEAEKREGEARSASAAPPLQHIGDYRIIREIGRGGMGIVYEAEQLSLGRHVALKVLPAHNLLDPRQLGRFQREAKAAARLHHTNIVPVYGVGEQDGVHYYVMQYIQGLGLDDVLVELRRFRQANAPPAAPDGGRPAGEFSAAAVARSLVLGAGGPPDAARAPMTRPAEESSSVHLPGQSAQSSLTDTGRTYWQSVARIGIQVAEALTYAHGQGTLHRDIKPSNLLLDTDATVWITDFGLAKAMDDQDNLTQTGDLVGTVRYMAPERFSSPGDARSDLYGLGLTLYELVTLRPAYDENDKNKLLKQVMHAEPPPPRKLNPAVPRDLETIILKAIARDPAHRYASAAELAEDLTRFLEDRPIRARRVSEWERAWRWCRRNPAFASLAAAFVLALVFGLAGVTWKWWEAAENLGEANRQRRKAEEAGAEAIRTRNESRRQSAGLLLDRGLALAEQGEAARGLHWMLESLRVAPADAHDLRRVARINLAAWSAQVHALRHIADTEVRSFHRVAFHPGGKTFATTSRNRVDFWSATTGERVGKPLHHQYEFTAVAYSPDGKMLVTGHAQGGAQRWDLAAGKPLVPLLPHPARVMSVAFRPDGKQLVTGCLDGGARLWEAATGKPVRPALVHDNPVLSVAFSPDGKSILAGTGRSTYTGGAWGAGSGAAYLWDVATGKRVGSSLRHKDRVAAVAFSPNGQTLLTGSRDNTARLWDRATGRPKGAPLRHRYDVGNALFTPDGATLVTASSQGFSAFLWDAATLQRLGTPLGHGESLDDLAVSPDGMAVVTGSGDGTVRVWEVGKTWSRAAVANPELEAEASPVRPVAGGMPVYLLTHRLEYSRDRKTVLTSDGSKVARLWDTATGRPLGVPLRHPWNVRTVALSPDGRYAATACHDPKTLACSVHLWDAATGRPLARPPAPPNWVSALAFSPDSRVLAMGGYDRQVRLWSVAKRRPLGKPLTQAGIVFSVAFSADGTTLAVGTVEQVNGARLWDVATGRPGGKPMPHKNWVVEVAFSPNRKTLLTRSHDRTVRLWDAATGEPVTPYLPHQGLGAAAFSPDGRTLALGGGTGGNDAAVRLWDAATGKPLPGATLPHGSHIPALAFSPDGRTLGVGGEDGTARLWDVATRKPLGPPLVQRYPIRGVAFTPNGRWFLTTADDGATRRWPVPAPLEGDARHLALRVQVRTGMQLDAGQAVSQLDPLTWKKRCRQLAALEGSIEGAYASSVSECDYHDARARDAEQDGNGFAALWHLDRLVALEPGEWLPYARRARVHTAAGRLDRADAEYRLARRHTSSAVLADWYRHRAVECEAAGQDATALWYLNRAAALRSADAGLFAHRAALHAKAGRFDDSVADWTRALKLRPDEWPWYAERAAAYGRLGKDAERDADLARAAAMK